MKIVHISTYLNGGAGNAAYRLHCGLLKNGIQSSFLFLHGGKSNNRINQYKHPTYYPRFHHRFFKKMGIPLNVLYNSELKNNKLKKRSDFEIFSWIKTDYKVDKHPAVKNADVIILHWISTFVDISTFFTNTTGKRIFWYLHDLNPVLGGFHLVQDLKHNQSISNINEKLILKKKHIYRDLNLTVIGNSNWTTLKAQKSEVFPSITKFNRIYLGINPNLFYPVDKTIAKKALGLDSDSKYILFGATDINRKWKGLGLLIEALDLFFQTYRLPNIKIMTIGSSKNLDYPFKMFGDVHHIELLRLIYSAADVLVNTSLEESLGLTIIEAMACGTPCIAFSVGGVPEIISNEINGILLENFSPITVAQALYDFLSKNNDHIYLNTRKTILEKFTLQDQVNEFLRLINH